MTMRLKFQLFLLVGLFGAGCLWAGGFEDANRRFETGDYVGAIGEYRQLLTNGTVSAAVWFNLGNAYFKDGQFGRGIFCFRQAQRLEPRDPDIRANLQFARKEVAGAFAVETATWQNFFRYLSPREWEGLTALAGFILFGALAIRERFRRERGALVWPTRLAVLFAMTCGVACPWAHAIWSDSNLAIVTVKKADARYGPLEDSKAAFQVRDGEELELLDEKGEWRQVRNLSGQAGWIEVGHLLTADEWPQS